MAQPLTQLEISRLRHSLGSKLANEARSRGIAADPIRKQYIFNQWRHRFIINRWVWELPGGYVDANEDPAATAAREVEEETGWRPRNVQPLVSLQPSVGTTDAENLLFVSHGADHIGNPEDINEAEHVAWLPLTSIRNRITTGEIVGAASITGLLHVLAFPDG
jgi:8-oxo-dGTP pyrophosphatase MutT (NUDIX family)